MMNQLFAPTCGLFTLLAVAIAISATGCGEHGASGVAVFDLRPVDDDTGRWSSSKPIALGSRFSVTTLGFAASQLGARSKDEQVVRRHSDGTFEAVGVGTGTLEAINTAGEVVDTLTLRILPPDDVSLTLAPALLHGDAKLPNTLWLLDGGQVQLQARLTSGGTELQHSGLVTLHERSGPITSVRTGSGSFTVRGSQGGHVDNGHAAAAQLQLTVKGMPEAARTVGVAIVSPAFIDDVTYHVGGQEFFGAQDGKQTLLVWLKAWTADRQQIHGAVATWESMVGHLEVIGPREGKPAVGAIVRGDVGAKGGLRVRIGDRDDVFILQLPAGAR